jgi:hypothetical protein
VGAQRAPLPPCHIDLKRQAVGSIGWHNEVPLPSENHLFNCLLVDWGEKLTLPQCNHCRSYWPSLHTASSELHRYCHSQYTTTLWVLHEGSHRRSESRKLNHRNHAGRAHSRGPVFGGNPLRLGVCGRYQDRDCAINPEDSREHDRSVARPTVQGVVSGVRNPLSGTDLYFYNRLKRWSPHKRRVAANDSCGGKLQAALAKFPPVVA